MDQLQNIGDRVVTAGTVRPSRFANRKGRVVTINRCSANYTEIGVSFDRSANVAAWYLPQELVIASAQAPSRSETAPDAQSDPKTVSGHTAKATG